MLVVIAIVAILIGILLPALRYGRSCAINLTELSAARQLMAAHVMYSDDHDQFVLPGFPTSAMVNSGDVVVRNQAGERVFGLSAQRYPWRLLPYADYELGLLYQDFERVSELREFEDGSSYEYVLSLAPRMGLNQVFVGGSGATDPTGLALLDNPANRQIVNRAFGNGWYVRRSIDAPRADRLLVFASATGSAAPPGLDLDSFDGNYQVQPPYFQQRLWAETDDPSTVTPGQRGFVAQRALSRSATGYLDGHAESLNWEQIQDMTRWAPKATSPDWTLPPLN